MSAYTLSALAERTALPFSSSPAALLGHTVSRMSMWRILHAPPLSFMVVSRKQWSATLGVSIAASSSSFYLSTTLHSHWETSNCITCSYANWTGLLNGQLANSSKHLCSFKYMKRYLTHFIVLSALPRSKIVGFDSSFSANWLPNNSAPPLL